MPPRLFEGTQFDIPPRCDRCGELEEACQCQPLPAPKLPPGEQTATVSLEKRKGGKFVTVVRGLSAEACDLSELITQLKNHCGAGGTVKADELEIQGKQAEKVVAKLSQIGFRIKQT